MIQREGFEINVNWKLTAFCAFFLPILIGLGVWQLNRATEKAVILKDWQLQQSQPALSIRYLSDLQAQTDRYKRVAIEGAFASETFWLIENKFSANKFGAHVVAPFKTDKNEWIAVNLGWIEVPKYRDQLPDVQLPKQNMRLTGLLDQVASSPLIDESKNPFMGWPHRMLEVDIAQMRDHLSEPLVNYVLKIDPDNTAAFTVNWQPINVSVDQHKGYALQWFAMAFALIILWLLASTNVINLLKNRLNKKV